MKRPVRPATSPGFGGAQRNMMVSGDKPKNFKKTLKMIGQYMRPYSIRVFIVIVFAVGSTIFLILSPRILGDMTNIVVDGYVAGSTYDSIIDSLPEGAVLPEGATGKDLIAQLPAETRDDIPRSQISKLSQIDFSKGRPGIDYAAIKIIGLWLATLYVLSSLFAYIQGWIMTDVTQRMVYRLRQDLSHKINRMTLSYFDKHPYGDVISRVTNDIDTISQSLNQSVTQIITSVITIIGVLAMMLTISWQLTLMAATILPLSLVVVGFIVRKSQHYFKQQQASLGDLDGHVEEMFSGHIAMRTYNGEQQSIDTFDRTNRELFASGWKSQFMSGLMMPIMQFIGNIGFVGIAVLGGHLAVNGRITVGGIQAFIQYLNQFIQPIRQTANVANVMQATVAAAERVFEFLDEAEQTPSDVQARLPKKIDGAVVFDSVDFGYSTDSPVIKDFSISVSPGQNIAIVGPTGAGKTTVVNLLMRFYEIDKGSITIDGINTKNLKRAEVRKLFGMVLQDAWLFNGTIADNIAYGKPRATKKQIVAAAKSAHADHFIRTLPNGYDTILDEETNNISVGEKQLLTIARAMLADAPMLILDEATSSVDTRTEVLIQKAMDRLIKGRTSFVIAHRLSTIKNADKILVMKAGRIIEQGTHDQLIKANGFYTSLYDSQFSDGEDV